MVMECTDLCPPSLPILDVKVKIHQYLGEMTLDIAAPSTVRNLLTEVSKKLPGKIASGDLIIKHGDKTPRIDQYVVDFSLQEPFHICECMYNVIIAVNYSYYYLGYKEMSREEKVYAMQAIIHPPSQHGGDIVDKHSAAAEFKGIQVFCHRENKHGNHASLYYPGFAEFTSMCKSVALTKEDCTFTSKLCACMSKYYDNEAARQKKCNELFSAYFGKAVAPKSIHNPPKSCICDGAIEAVLYIEYKLEVGHGNCDSYTEVIAYYIEDLLSGNLSSSCRPSFLVEIVGPHMFVSGAVFADTVHVDRLTPPVWLVVQPLDEVEMIRTAKTLKALKTACIALERSVACPQPRFPAFCQFDENTLEYLEQIGLHLFKCIVKPSNVKCVVKFALRYCKEAHALLANAGYAPRLLHVGMSSNFHVVVMEDVEGALTVDNYIAKNEGDRDDILEKCRKALCTLHSKGYCHGDFRPCNILVSLTKEVKVIDFDWAGKVNVAVYPFFMNHQSITWPGGAEDGAHLSKEHDMYWLAKIEQN